MCRTKSRRLSRAGRAQTTPARLAIQGFIQLGHRLGMGNHRSLFGGTHPGEDAFQQLQPFRFAFVFADVLQHSGGPAPLRQDDRTFGFLDLRDDLGRAHAKVADRRQVVQEIEPCHKTSPVKAILTVRLQYLLLVSLSNGNKEYGNWHASEGEAVPSASMSYPGLAALWDMRVQKAADSASPWTISQA